MDVFFFWGLREAFLIIQYMIKIDEIKDMFHIIFNILSYVNNSSITSKSSPNREYNQIFYYSNFCFDNL